MTGARCVRPVTAGLVLLSLAGALAFPARGQAIIKVSETVAFRFGVALQIWADWTETPATGGTAENLFIRRARLYYAGQVGPRVSFFAVAVASNAFKAPKGSGPSVFVEDAYGEWAILPDSVLLDAGLLLIPLCRDCLTQTVRLLTLDVGSFSFLATPSTQSVSGRDTGFQAKGYLLGDRLEYRLAAFQGRRDADARNPLRASGRLQYEFFEVEKGQFYPGTYLGTRKVLAIGAGFDSQMSYRAYDADLFLDLPLPGKSGITAQVDFIHYDGGSTFPAIASQNDLLAEAGWYFGGVRLLPFFRYEQQNFDRESDRLANRRNVQAGLTWYPYGHTLNLRGAWICLQRPNDPAAPSVNQFTIQLQFFYF